MLAKVLINPGALPHATVLRAARKPVFTPDESQAIDTKQTHQLYRHNTWCVVHAICRILEHFRVAPLSPDALQEYMDADVAHVPPAKDMALALRILELRIAAAMYGPRSRHFVCSFLQLLCGETKSALHSIVAGVATFFELLPFE